MRSLVVALALGKWLKGEGRSLIKNTREQVRSLVIAIAFAKWLKGESAIADSKGQRTSAIVGCSDFVW